jgi:DNA-binding response OmpR family regulator
MKESQEIMERQTILLAEGEPDLRRFYFRSLEREGFRLLTAASGVEALAKVRSEKPDLVVLDLRLPSEGGLETLNHILEDPDAPPVILTSESPIWEEGFMVWNAEGCIEKSADLGELKQVIVDALARRESRRKKLSRTSPPAPAAPQGTASV